MDVPLFRSFTLNQGKKNTRCDEKWFLLLYPIKLRKMYECAIIDALPLQAIGCGEWHFDYTFVLLRLNRFWWLASLSTFCARAAMTTIGCRRWNCRKVLVRTQRVSGGWPTFSGFRYFCYWLTRSWCISSTSAQVLNMAKVLLCKQRSKRLLKLWINEWWTWYESVF